MDFNEVVPELIEQIKKLTKRVKALEDAAQPVAAVSKTPVK